MAALSAARKGKERSSGFRVLASFGPFFRPYGREIGAWFFIYGAYFLVGIFTPLALKIYVDRILRVNDPVPAAGKGMLAQALSGHAGPSPEAASFSRLSLFVAGFALYALCLLFLQFLGQRGTAKIIEKVVAELRASVYEKLHRLTIGFHDQTLSGELVARVTQDTRQLLNLVGGDLVNVGLATIMGVVSFAILLSWDLRVALVVLAFLPAYASLFYYFLPRIRKVARLWRRSNDILWGNWNEKLRGMNIIQAFTREKNEALKHHRYGHGTTDHWERMTTYGNTMSVWGEFTASLSRQSVYALGCYLVIGGDMTNGMWVALGPLVNYILAPVQGVFNLVNTWQQSTVAAERVKDTLEEVEEALAGERRRLPGRFKGEIRFEHLFFEYKKDVPVLQDVDFAVKPGQSVALVGHTGCGKSTLVNLLLGFYRPLKGLILIDSVAVTDMNSKDLRRNIGVVPQDILLFQDSIRANVCYGKPEATEEQVWEVLKTAQIEDYVRQLPDGLETRVGGRQGVNPSKGQAQRLCIARALLTDPSIVILDEATSSLDSTEEARLQKAVGELFRGRTSLIIAHRLSTIRQCDLVVVMERGKVLEIGNPGELLAKEDSVYARLNKAHFFDKRDDEP
jgi:ABC-type multidrug transport system fused ATPase/permease subunit